MDTICVSRVNSPRDPVKIRSEVGTEDMEKIDIYVTLCPVKEYVAKCSKRKLQAFLDEGVDLSKSRNFEVGTTKIPGYRNVPGGWVIRDKVSGCVYYYDRDDGVQELSLSVWRLCYN